MNDQPIRPFTGFEISLGYIDPRTRQSIWQVVGNGPGDLSIKLTETISEKGARDVLTWLTHPNREKRYQAFEIFPVLEWESSSDPQKNFCETVEVKDYRKAVIGQFARETDKLVLHSAFWTLYGRTADGYCNALCDDVSDPPRRLLEIYARISGNLEPYRQYARSRTMPELWDLPASMNSDQPVNEPGLRPHP